MIRRVSIFSVTGLQERFKYQNQHPYRLITYGIVIVNIRNIANIQGTLKSKTIHAVYIGLWRYLKPCLQVYVIDKNTILLMPQPGHTHIFRVSRFGIP